jgi:hypothetical protein
MDGFMKGSTGSGSPQSKIPKITEASNLLTPKGASYRLRTAAQGVHTRAQRSQTLMRTAVKKPAELAKTVNSGVRQAEIRRPKAPQIDRARMARVQTIDKNTSVRRFGHGAHAPASAKAAPAAAPAIAAEGEVISRQAGGHQADSSKASGNSSLIHKPLPSLITSASHQQLERMLDEALTKADAHKRGRHGRMPNQSLVQRIKNMPRWATIGSTIAAGPGYYFYCHEQSAGHCRTRSLR